MNVREFIAKIGGLRLCALDLGVTEQAISAWYKKGVPSSRIKVISDYCYGMGFEEFNARFISELEVESKKMEK